MTTVYSFNFDLATKTTCIIASPSRDGSVFYERVIEDSSVTHIDADGNVKYGTDRADNTFYQVKRYLAISPQQLESIGDDERFKALNYDVSGAHVTTTACGGVGDTPLDRVASCGSSDGGVGTTCNDGDNHDASSFIRRRGVDGPAGEFVPTADHIRCILENIFGRLIEQLPNHGVVHDDNDRVHVAVGVTHPINYTGVQIHALVDIVTSIIEKYADTYLPDVEATFSCRTLAEPIAVIYSQIIEKEPEEIELPRGSIQVGDNVNPNSVWWSPPREEKKYDHEEASLRTAVIDMGAGTIDVSVVDRSEKSGYLLDVACALGDNFVGGENIDTAMWQHLVDSGNAGSFSKHEVEQLKIRYSNSTLLGDNPRNNTTTIYIPPCKPPSYEEIIQYDTNTGVISRFYERVEILPQNNQSLSELIPYSVFEAASEKLADQFEAVFLECIKTLPPSRLFIIKPGNVADINKLIAMVRPTITDIYKKSTLKKHGVTVGVKDDGGVATSAEEEITAKIDKLIASSFNIHDPSVIAAVRTIIAPMKEGKYIVEKTLLPLDTMQGLIKTINDYNVVKQRIHTCVCVGRSFQNPIIRRRLKAICDKHDIRIHIDYDKLGTDNHHVARGAAVFNRVNNETGGQHFQVISNRSYYLVTGNFAICEKFENTLDDLSKRVLNNVQLVASCGSSSGVSGALGACGASPLDGGRSGCDENDDEINTADTHTTLSEAGSAADEGCVDSDAVGGAGDAGPRVSSEEILFCEVVKSQRSDKPIISILNSTFICDSDNEIVLEKFRANQDFVHRMRTRGMITDGSVVIPFETPFGKISCVSGAHVTSTACGGTVDAPLDEVASCESSGGRAGDEEDHPDRSVDCDVEDRVTYNDEQDRVGSAAVEGRGATGAEGPRDTTRDTRELFYMTVSPYFYYDDTNHIHIGLKDIETESTHDRPYYVDPNSDFYNFMVTQVIK